MEKCVVCGMAINNHSYLLEDSPLFFTHCFECQHNLLIAKERGTKMKGMKRTVIMAEVRENALIDHIDNKHIYPVYTGTGRRVFVRPQTMNREKDKDSAVKAA